VKRIKNKKKLNIVLTKQKSIFISFELSRVSTGLQNPGKSLNWKKNSRIGKSVEILESPGINFLNLRRAVPTFVILIKITG
jgi:hypothetical protein